MLCSLYSVSSYLIQNETCSNSCGFCTYSKEWVAESQVLFVPYYMIGTTYLARESNLIPYNTSKQIKLIY